MRKVLFWRDIVSDMSEYQDYEVTINALLNGEYTSLRLEKLNINTISPIYSIRHNQDTRIIFTTIQQSICILEVILNHDYAKSRFLRNRHCLKHFLDKMDETLATITSSPIKTLDIPSYKDTPYEIKYIEFQQHFIELSEIQEETLNTSFPFVLHGPAGSGKTTLAILLLKNFVRNNIKPVIYLTVSHKLKDYVQNLWHSMNPEDAHGIKFMTYEDFLIDVLNVDKATIISDADFSEWYQRLKKFPFSEIQLHQEFRILSGYYNNLDDYLELGERQSLIPKEFRPQIIELFELYLKHLGHHLSKELSLIKCVRSDIHVIIDEAQDLSYAQLENILNFSGPHAAILLGDHQVLFDGVSRYPFIKQFYYDNFKAINLETIALPTSFRCCEHVTVVANEIVKLKYQVTGGALDKIETGEMLSDLRETGLVQWFDANPHQLETFKTLESNTSCALINFSNEANHSFTNFLVFNPYEIKGLEYDTIILWNPFDQTHAISKLLPAEQESLQISGNRAKAGHAHFEHLNYFNRLITAVTRAKKKLVFIHPKRNDKPNVMVNRIRSICAVIDEWQEQIDIPSSEADWLHHARQLLKLGYDEQAKKIFIQKLNRPVAAFETFKRNIFQTESLKILEPISPKVSSPTQVSPTSVPPIKTPSPSNTLDDKTTPEDGVMTESAKSFHHMLQYNTSIVWFMNFFKIQTNCEIRTLLTTKVDNQTAIDLICNDEIVFRNFIYTLSSSHVALFKIHSIAQHLISQIKDNNHTLFKVLSFIKKHSNYCNPTYQYTLLHLASELKNHAIIRLCLQNNADPNILAGTITAAHLACQKRSHSIESLKILKEYGARFDFLDNSQYLPLHYAIENEQEEIIQFFIEEKVALDTQTFGLHRPLSMAVMAKNIKIFELLIKNGANPLLELDEKSCIVYLLVEMGLTHFIEVLVKYGFNLETTLICGYQLAHIAAQKNQVRVLQYLKNKGANLINDENPDNLSPLHIAVKEGNLQTVRFFLESNISPDLVTPKSSSITPAYLAAEHNKLKILELLHAFNANFNQTFSLGATPILIAANKKYFAVFEFLLKKSGCADVTFMNGQTIAHILARHKHSDTIKLFQLLKKYHAKFDIQDNSGCTPLMLAIKAENDEIVQFLLGEIVTYETKDICGNTILHMAAEHQIRGIVESFVTRQLDLNPKNFDEITPLEKALMLNKIHIAEQLIKAGARLVFENHRPDALYLAMENQLHTLIPLIIQKMENSTPSLFSNKSFLKAVSLGNLDVIQKMLNGSVSIDAMDANGFAAIHYAVDKKQIKVIELLAKNGANINLFDGRKRSPLINACVLEHIPTVITLLKNGANPNLTHPDSNKSPLMYLSERNNTILVKELLKYQIEIDLADDRLFTSLLIACYRNHIQTAEILLKAHANPNRKNINGKSCVSYAVQNFNIDLLNLLIKYQGSLDIYDNSGHSLLHLAAMHSNSDNLAMVEYLIQKKFNINDNTPNGMTPIMLTIQKNNEACFDLLCRYHAQLNNINAKGETCLHLVAILGSVSWFEKICSMGLDIEAKTHDDETPLYYAFKEFNQELSDYLIKSGANLFVRDKNHKNLLHWACELGQCQYIQLLISKGLDIHTPDMSLNTPIDYAIIHNRIEATRLLLSLGAKISSSVCLEYVRNKQWNEMIDILEAAIKENDQTNEDTLRVDF